MGIAQLWPLGALPEDHAMRSLWQPTAEDVPPVVREMLTKKSIVVSCPERGTLDPHGGPNTATNAYDSPVMATVMQLQQLSAGAILMGFDRAGTSTADDRDQAIWDKLNPKKDVYERDETARKELVKRTFWFAGYKVGVKQTVKTSCQAFGGIVEMICLHGGLVTQVEQEEMATIISEGTNDAGMFGLQCQIVRKDMSFHAFVQEYGQPYGVTVQSVLVQAPSNVSPLQRQHTAPEPQREHDAHPETDPHAARPNNSSCVRSCIFFVVALILLVCAVKLGEDDGLPKRKEVTLSNGTAPPCSTTKYLLDGLCHTCDDCVSGQMCSTRGGDPGCHDCPAGRYDDDFDATTNCVDCPSEQTAAPQSTECEQPDDFWDKLLERLCGFFGVLASVGAAWTALREMDCRTAWQEMSGRPYSQVDAVDREDKP
jgi:hypothetical protein